ncbi:MAG: AAA family ATPase [Bacilli bacterium]|nr:AAA family ATPase [Bacilli bacterium]
MSIFNKTDEEMKNEETYKKLRYLNSEIWSRNHLQDPIKYYLSDYVDKIRRGYPNDFMDVDTLGRIVLKLIDSHYEDENDFQKHFNELIVTFHQVVEQSEDSKRMSDIFVSYFVGNGGLLYQKLYDEGLYSFFQNKNDYFDFMNKIMSDERLINLFPLIRNYLYSVSKYCLNQDILKRDIISFLDGLSNYLGDDYKEYSREQLEEAKKRIGIYQLNPKDLADVDSKLHRMEDYVSDFHDYRLQLENDKALITSMIDHGKSDIIRESKKSVESLKTMIEKQKKIFMDTLDEHLLDIEEVLKDKSDETFRQILETYQSQVNEFRNLFKSYSLSTSKDLLAIQKASEESVKKLQDYVSSDPHLQELLTKAQEENVVREKIIQLVSREEELMRVPEKKVVEEVTIPGYEQRIMVPYKHMVLPSEITTITNPMFDERVPFSKRKETLLQRLEKREKEGEIFHKKVPQIAVDIMEGDWPYLWGPSGTGKSYMAKQVASLLGMDLTKAGKITEPYSILGYNDPQGRYQITPSFIAALYGNLLFLDELDNGNPDTQVVLNDIYSELLNKLDDPSEICEVTFGTDVNVDIHPNFRMIGAGNTSGEGENEAFSSRGKMDESIQERMTPIYIDYDNRVEQQILNDYPEWYKFFIDFRDACRKYADSMGYSSAQGITTTRDAAAIKKYIMHNSKSVDQVIAERFVQIKDSEYRKALGNTIADIYGISYQDCQNPNYKGSLEKVDRKVLAKKFITACKKGVE